MSDHHGPQSASAKDLAWLGQHLSRGWHHSLRLGRVATDLILPPLAHDSPEAVAEAGLSPDTWSRIHFLEAPVCDGCGSALDVAPTDLSDDRCPACLAQPFAFDRARAACVYDAASRGPILALKHGDQQTFARLFAQWISRAASDLIDQADVLVPIPLHRWRLLGRRFNQAAEISRPLARLRDREHLPDALIRTRHTPSQGGRSLRGRQQNVRHVFTVTPSGQQRLRGRRVLLIDDVLTTGATAEAASRALLAAGARAVDLAVVARVRDARTLST